MTLTVKLDPELEQRLRRRSAALGRTTSDVVREALESWLAAPAAARFAPSPFDLGAHLFGRHRGPADLASSRKALLGAIWAEKIEAASPVRRPSSRR